MGIVRFLPLLALALSACGSSEPAPTPTAADAATPAATEGTAPAPAVAATQTNEPAPAASVVSKADAPSELQPGERKARCKITNAGEGYTGPCLFSAGRDGSFAIRRANGEPIDGATDVSVQMVSKGVANVRGLTEDGINSNWGDVKRSKKDPACWTGSDFEICVY